MLLAQRPRELMLVGDEHRNQYFQVNIQVLTFFSFIFQCAQGTAFGLRLTLVDVVDDDEMLNCLSPNVSSLISWCEIRFSAAPKQKQLACD